MRSTDWPWTSAIIQIEAHDTCYFVVRLLHTCILAQGDVNSIPHGQIIYRVLMTVTWNTIAPSAHACMQACTISNSSLDQIVLIVVYTCAQVGSVNWSVFISLFVSVKMINTIHVWTIIISNKIDYVYPTMSCMWLSEYQYYYWSHWMYQLGLI